MFWVHKPFRPFTCLIDKEIMKAQPTPVHETAFDLLVQLLERKPYMDIKDL